jgi:hypothetical protein
MDLGLTVGLSGRVPLDVGVGDLGPVLLALLRPLVLLGRDGDETVGRDAVLAAELPDGDLAGDVLALNVGEEPQVDRLPRGWSGSRR